MENLVEKYAFDRPIPGESLTDAPTGKYPWERPPEISTVEEGTKYLFKALSNKDTLPDLLDQIRDGMSLEDIATLITRVGFSEGKWTMDLALLLVEPTIYMLYFLATQAGIEPIIYEDEDDDLDPEEEAEILTKKTKSNTPLPLGGRRR